MEVYSKEELKRDAGEEELNPQEKAAILLVALGEESAGEVMKYLADYEIEELSQTITELKHLPIELQDMVLEEFEQHLMLAYFNRLHAAGRAANRTTIHIASCIRWGTLYP